MNHEPHESHEKILFKAVFEVYRELGCGFLEAVYQECMERGLATRNIPYVSQKELILTYKDKPLEQRYKPDLICFDKIVVEIKAVNELGKEDKAQLFNYLKARGLRLGLLVNFGHFPKAEVEKIIL